MTTWMFAAVAVFFVIVVWMMFRGELVGAMRCELYNTIGHSTARVSVRRVGRQSGNPTVQLQMRMFPAARASFLSPADAVLLAEMLEDAAARVRPP